ncbi:hypothetical protein HaLaN_30023, partial [Haematococcus lacustris]
VAQLLGGLHAMSFQLKRQHLAKLAAALLPLTTKDVPSEVVLALLQALAGLGLQRVAGSGLGAAVLEGKLQAGFRRLLQPRRAMHWLLLPQAMSSRQYQSTTQPENVTALGQLGWSLQLRQWDALYASAARRSRTATGSQVAAFIFAIARYAITSTALQQAEQAQAAAREATPATAAGS